jgi:hypothetical protein
MRPLVICVAGPMQVPSEPLIMADMETYEPNKPSGITTGDVVSPVDGTSQRLTIENFGIEDSQPARQYGRDGARLRPWPSRGRDLARGLEAIPGP